MLCTINEPIIKLSYIQGRHERVTLQVCILYNMYYITVLLIFITMTGQVGLGVGSWPSNRATEGSYPKGTLLYFVILLKNVEFFFDWH